MRDRERHHGDIDSSEFREQGHKLIDWIADYLENAERYPVRSRARPGELKRQLPASPPEQGQSLADIFARVEETLVLSLTHWNHPNFLAYFAVTGSEGVLEVARVKPVA